MSDEYEEKEMAEKLEYRHEQEMDELNSQLAAAKAENERLREALEDIARWCKSIKPNYIPSRFAKGCVTPDGETVLAENLWNIAKAALSQDAGKREG